MPSLVVSAPALARVARIARSLALGLSCVLACMGARADIVVGQVAPFSGPQAVTGRAIHAGAKLYFDAVNARGGVRGQRIKFLTRDDEQKTDGTLRLVKELIEQEHPIALLGTVGTTNLEALAKDGVLARTRVPMVGAIYRARGYGFSVVLPLPSQQKVPLVREYLALSEAAKDPDLSTRSIEGFIAAKLLVRALERAASLEPQAVATAVASLSAFDAGGYSLDFSTPGRGGSRFVDFAMIGSGGRVTQ